MTLTQKLNSTRLEILMMLRKQGQMSANELASQLEITDMAVRRHLQTLEKDHLIQAKLVRQAMGRPTYAYSLTEQAETMFPKNYVDITLDLLQDIEELQGKGMVKQLFDRREARLSQSYQEQMVGDTLDERVKELAHIQDSKGYMVEWEKDEQTGDYYLTEYNCPIHMVAHQYTQACQSELTLFRNVLEAEIEQLECKAKGGKRCVYLIRDKKQ